MARSFQEVIRIVLEAVGADSADKLAEALGDVGDVSDETRAQLLALADAMAKAAGAGDQIDAYRKTGEQLRKVDETYRDLGNSVKQLDAAEKASAAVLAEKRKALADAERTQQSYADGSHALLGTEKQIRETRRQAADAVKALTAEVKAAERVNKSDAAALERQRSELAKVAQARQAALTTLRQQKAALEAAGVDTSRLAAEEKRLVAESIKAETAMRELAQATREQASVAGEAAGNQKTLWQALGETKLALAGAAAGMVGVTRVLSGAAKESAEFQKSMAALSTIAEGSDLRAVSDEVRGLGTAYGNVQAQAKGLYEIIAAGIEDTASATEILDTANRLAIGGVADLEASAGGLVAALNAYGKSASEAKSVSDQFFVSAAAGNTTIEELATNIGGVAPLAAQSGVALDQLLASVGALTAGGLGTAQAFTQVQSIIAAVVKPTMQAQRAAEQLGIQFDTAALRSKGFAQFLNDIAVAANHDETVLAKLFGRVEGLQGVLSLTGNLADTFSRTLDDMANSAGRTDSAFEKMNDTAAQASARFKAAIDNLQISLGNVLTAFTPVVNVMTSLMNGFTQLPAPIQTVTLAIAGLAAAALPAVVAFRALSTALAGLSGVQTISALAASASTAAGAVSLLWTAVSRLTAIGGALYLFGEVASLIKDYREQSKAAALATRELADAQQHIAAQIEQTKEAYAGLADLQIRSNAEVEKLSGYNLKAYLSQLDAAAKYWRAVEIEAKRAGDATQQAFAREKADQYGQAVDNVGKRLDALKSKASGIGRQISAELQEAFDSLDITSQQALDDAASNAERALKRIVAASKEGEVAASDVRRAFEAWATAARASAADASESTKALVEAQIEARAKILGISGAYAQNAQESQKALQSQLADLKTLRDQAARTAADLADQMRRAMGQGFSDEIITGLRDRYKEAQTQADLLANSVQKLESQINTTGQKASESVREIGAGFIDVEKTANTADRAIQEMADNTDGAAEALAGVLNGMRDSLKQYGDAAVAEFDRIFESLASVDNRWQTTGMTLTQILGKVAGIANAVAERHRIAQEAAERHARSMAYLSEHADEAASALAEMGYTLDDVRSGAVSANTALLALGNQRMNKLRPELQGVADALEGIEQGARDATASLAEMNREMEKAELQRQGDERAIARMEHEERLREIDELAAAAGAAGAAEAAEARRRAEAEHQARLREIRDREKEEKRSNKSVDDDRQTSRQRSGGGSGGGLGSDTQRIEIVVNNQQRSGEEVVEMSDRDIEAVASRVIQAIAAAGRIRGS